MSSVEESFNGLTTTYESFETEYTEFENEYKEKVGEIDLEAKKGV